MTPCPTLPVHTNLASRDFFLFPWMKKILKGKCLGDVEEVKQKQQKQLTSIKISKFKTNMSSGKNGSMGVLHQMENTLKVNEV